jgi:hypothetical protein
LTAPPPHQFIFASPVAGDSALAVAELVARLVLRAAAASGLLAA